MLRYDTKQLYGLVMSSKIRKGILDTLFKSSTLRQSEIARLLGQKQQNIYKSMDDLQKAGLIECLEPEKKAWKSYMITESGKEVLQYEKRLKEETARRNKKA